MNNDNFNIASQYFATWYYFFIKFEIARRQPNGVDELRKLLRSGVTTAPKVIRVNYQQSPLSNSLINSNSWSDSDITC